ncbi:MAG TPA: VOC family protein [Myxococcota bacterium]|nr:VOC family protein [Myxococcota bacterium]
MAVAISGFAHVNLNCAELARSKRFYEHALGLRALVHTDPAPQDCSAFGLSEPGQWDAWMLGYAEPGSGIALDLLEWLRPRPLPAPPPPALGFAALGFDVPDVDAAIGLIEGAGGRARILAGENARTFAALDPDGQLIHVREGERSRMAFVRVSCSELERSLAFYAEVFGLKAVAGFAPSSTMLALPGEASGFRVELAWAGTTGAGQPGPARAEANRLGLFRMAFLCPDLARAHAELQALGVPGLSAVADLDLGPSCPAPRCRALFFRDPDGACVELIEVPAPT